MAETAYHAHACVPAGVPARVSADRLDVLARRQRQLGVRFPEAVVEWYAIDGAVEFQASHSDDHVMSLAEMGLPYHDDDYVTAGVLLITNENQDCYTLVVPLDGRPNPPVQIMDPFDLELEEAVARSEPFADTFSDYVRACVFDASAHRAPWQRVLDRVPFTPEVLTALRAAPFEELPATGTPGDQVTYRFKAGSLTLTATVFRAEATVRLGAGTEAGLDELLGLLPFPVR